MSLERPVFVCREKNGWRLRVWVQPGAKKTELAGLHGEHLKIRVQAPAVDNKANKVLTAFVAHVLGLKNNQVELECGHGARQKSLLVLTEDEPDWSSLSSGAEGKL